VDRDDLFIILALKARLLSPAQVEDCRRERQVHGQNAAAPTLPEIVAQKEYLNPEQRRLLVGEGQGQHQSNRHTAEHHAGHHAP